MKLPLGKHTAQMPALFLGYALCLFLPADLFAVQVDGVIQLQLVEDQFGGLLRRLRRHVDDAE